MAYGVELTRRASLDLSQIYRRIHAEDTVQASIWFNGLEAMVYSLGNTRSAHDLPHTAMFEP